jgi:hypothetical protein
MKQKKLKIDRQEAFRKSECACVDKTIVAFFLPGWNAFKMFIIRDVWSFFENEKQKLVRKKNICMMGFCCCCCCCCCCSSYILQEEPQENNKVDHKLLFSDVEDALSLIGYTT